MILTGFLELVKLKAFIGFEALKNGAIVAIANDTTALWKSFIRQTFLKIMAKTHNLLDFT